jgi:hypothetical protein
MNLFAHDGVDHATTSEAATHSIVSVIFITLLVTVATVLVAGSAIYMVNRFALKKIPIKDREDD